MIVDRVATFARHGQFGLANELADGALRFLHANGVDTSAIVRGGKRLGVYFLEHGAAQRGSLVIYDRDESGIAEIQAGTIDWTRALDGARWFHLTGITPALSELAAGAALEAVTVARRLGLSISIDLNYRAKLWRWGRPAGEVMAELVDHADVIIGNEEDAARVFGIEASGVDVAAARVDAERYADVVEALVARFPRVQAVGITLRGSHSASHNSWAGLLWTRDGLITSRSYDILPVVDRVGAGDAFAAGLIYGLLRDTDPQSTLEFAVAASCLKHGFSGDVNLATRTEIERLAGGDQSGRVTR